MRWPRRGPVDPLVQRRLDQQAAIDAGPILEPDSVSTRMTRAENLAHAMLESTTEYSLHDLPLHLDMRLRLLCVDLVEWMGDPVDPREDRHLHEFYVTEVPRPRRMCEDDDR